MMAGKTHRQEPDSKGNPSVCYVVIMAGVLLTFHIQSRPCSLLWRISLLFIWNQLQGFQNRSNAALLHSGSIFFLSGTLKYRIWSMLNWKPKAHIQTHLVFGSYRSTTISYRSEFCSPVIRWKSFPSMRNLSYSRYYLLVYFNSSVFRVTSFAWVNFF